MQYLICNVTCKNRLPVFNARFLDTKIVDRSAVRGVFVKRDNNHNFRQFTLSVFINEMMRVVLQAQEKHFQSFYIHVLTI